MSVQIHTSWGCIVVEHDASSVRACRLPSAGPFDSSRSCPPPVLHTIRADTTSSAQPIVADLKQFFAGLFAGERAEWDAIHWPIASTFRLQAWRYLCTIPWGTTRTYGALARDMGRAGGARAVGQACAANPLPLFVPCHRVLTADHGLGGFSAGTAWKQWLLQQEQGTC